jgi:hypothetical protein
MNKAARCLLTAIAGFGGICYLMFRVQTVASVIPVGVYAATLSLHFFGLRVTSPGVDKSNWIRISLLGSAVFIVAGVVMVLGNMISGPMAFVIWILGLGIQGNLIEANEEFALKRELRAK